MRRHYIFFGHLLPALACLAAILAYPSRADVITLGASAAEGSPAREMPRQEDDEASDPILGPTQSNYLAAAECFRAHDFGQARLFVRAGLQLMPQHPMLLSLAGLIELRDGQLDEARGAWTYLEQLHPDNVSVMAGLAGIDLYSGEFSRARLRLDKALRARPDETTALFYQALFIARENGPPAALRVLNPLRLRDLGLFARALQDERALILRCLSPDRYDALVSGLLRLSATNAVAGTLERCVPHLEKAAELQRLGDGEGLVQHLEAVQQAGAGNLLIAYELGLARYRLAPSEARLRDLGALLRREGGGHFIESLVELGLRDGYAKVIEDVAGMEIDRMPVHRALLLRAALRRAQGDVAGAWVFLDRIPKARRAELAPWFREDLDVVRQLEGDPPYAAWRDAEPP